MYAYNVATDEDENDFPVLRSMGSPGSDIASDEVVYVNDAGQIVVERDPSGPGWDEELVMADPEPLPRPIGPRMREALDFIASHPGCSKSDIYRGTGVHRGARGGGPVDRLLDRGLIYDLGPSHRYMLYAWQPQTAPENDRPAGTWANRNHP
jgi:hypothetical protein